MKIVIMVKGESAEILEVIDLDKLKDDLFPPEGLIKKKDIKKVWLED